MSDETEEQCDAGKDRQRRQEQCRRPPGEPEGELLKHGILLSDQNSLRGFGGLFDRFGLSSGFAMDLSGRLHRGGRQGRTNALLG